MSGFILILVTGIGLGALYFLVASGLSLIYGLMGVLNFAHGSFLTIGAFTGLWVSTKVFPSPTTWTFVAAMIAGGFAALTLAPEGLEVTTVEYKINFLAAFRDGELRATGTVVRAGKRVTVATVEVLHVDAQGRSSPCALMQQTLTTVPASS
jgi:uncharacterized protein (TIGR00369 family)